MLHGAKLLISAGSKERGEEWELKNPGKKDFSQLYEEVNISAALKAQFLQYLQVAFLLHINGGAE